MIKPSLKMRTRVFDSEEHRRNYYLECSRQVLPLLLEKNEATALEIAERAAVLGFAMTQKAEEFWRDMRELQLRKEARDDV